MGRTAGRVGLILATPLLTLVAGIPFLVGIYIDSVIITAIFPWDTWTVFLVQAVPITVLVLVTAIAKAASGELGE